MKRVITLILVLVMSLALLPGTPDAAAQQGFYLVCRGGGNLYFDYTPFSNFSPDPQLWITFERGPQGVGSGWSDLSSLGPGQCAWLDRAVAPDEPDRIIIVAPVIQPDDFSITWTQGEVTGISSALYFINGLQDDSEYQSFLVYNDSQGNFVVLKIDQGTYHPFAPEQISPADESVFDHFPRTTTLTWSPVDGAASYTVEVDCLDCCQVGWWCAEFDQPWLVGTDLTSTEFTFDFVGAQPGRWRVWATYENGRESAKSDWWIFTYTR